LLILCTVMKMRTGTFTQTWFIALMSFWISWSCSSCFLLTYIWSEIWFQSCLFCLLFSNSFFLKIYLFLLILSIYGLYKMIKLVRSQCSIRLALIHNLIYFKFFSQSSFKSHLSYTIFSFLLLSFKSWKSVLNLCLILAASTAWV